MRILPTARISLALAAAMAAGIGIGHAQQTHMLAALQSLRTARQELAAALPNKGGHREKAIQLVNQAIDETNLGIRAGRGR
jgi:hypothetical protein